MNGWDFVNYADPVGRKQYKCQWCREPILIGEKHHHYWGKYDGEMQDIRMHTECAKAAQRSDLDDGLPMETIPRGMTYDAYDAMDPCEECSMRVCECVQQGDAVAREVEE